MPAAAEQTLFSPSGRSPRPDSSAAGCLLVFADDWGRHPSSCQHLISQLLPRYRTGWVNTIGTRPPRLDRATFARAAGKLRGWTGGGPRRESAAPPGPDVLQPIMLPWIRRRWQRSLNRSLLLRRLRQWLDAAPGPVTAVTTVPIVADLMGRLPVSRWVYYRVDDFSQWPGLDGPSLAAMEREVLARADRVVAASEVLVQTSGRSDATLLTHGVDLSHWSAKVAAPAEISEFPRPRALFWGLIDRRLDPHVVRAVAGALGHGTLVLLGPEQDPDDDLARIPGVRRIPAASYADLPAYAAAADILVMPYADAPVTRAMQPLKLLEYLATDRPVVARDLPAVRAWGDALDIAPTPEEFVQAVRRRLDSGLPMAQAAARRRLDGESWVAKSATFERVALL